MLDGNVLLNMKPADDIFYFYIQQNLSGTKSMKILVKLTALKHFNNFFFLSNESV